MSPGESEALFRLVFENSEDAILWADCRTGLLIRCNAAALRLFERTQEELIGQTHAVLHPSDKLEEYRKLFEEHSAQNKSKSPSVEIVTKSGRIKWVEISSTVINLRGKQINQGIFVDVTQRRWAEERLKASEERYRTLFASSQDALMTLSPPSWQFTSGNPATVAMFGAQNESDFVSRAPWEYSPEYQANGQRSDEKAREMIVTAMREGSHFFEWTHRRLTDENFPATVLLTRVEIGGEVFLQATVRDISAWKKAEEEMIFSERRAAVGKLAAGIAHEFNNILASIRSHAQLSKELNEEDQQLVHLMSSIENLTSRGADIVEGMMTLSRPRKYKIQPCRLVDVVGDVLLFQEAELRREGVEVRHEFDQDLDVLADRNSLGQVFLNLVVNARHAMRSLKGGVLTISANADDQRVTVHVRDTGIGMTTEALSQAFAPFFTTKGPPAKDGVGIKGTGLGLAVCQSIIRDHGGTIGVESDPGTGTVFKITLPRGRRAD